MTDGPSNYLGSDGGHHRPPTLFINIGVPLKNLVGLTLLHPWAGAQRAHGFKRPCVYQRRELILGATKM